MWTDRFETVPQVEEKREEIQAERSRLANLRASLEMEINESKRRFASGEGPANIDWLLQSERKFRKVGIELQEWQNKLADLKRREKAINARLHDEREVKLEWKDHFVRCAKIALDEGVFRDICDMASEAADVQGSALHPA